MVDTTLPKQSTEGSSGQWTVTQWMTFLYTFAYKELMCVYYDMVSDTPHGLIYCVVLANNVDKWTLVPDLMRAHRREILLYDQGYIDDPQNKVDIICICDQREAFGRLWGCKYFQERRNHGWYDSRRMRSPRGLETVDQCLIPEMVLTPCEEAFRDSILEHDLVKDNIHDEYLPGWYDQFYNDP